MLLKTIKIFLKLKWQETLGSVSKDDWQFYSIVTLSLILSYIVGRFLNVASVDMLNVPYIIKSIMYIVFGFFILLFLFGIVMFFIWLVKQCSIFCKWIASNWREAKRLAEMETK